MRALQEPGELRMHGRVVGPQDAIGVPGLGM
jgi:hypothetical protein